MRLKPTAILSPCDITSVTRFAKLLVNYVRAIHCVSLFFFGRKRQYIVLMSSNESGGNPQSCESLSETDPALDASVNSDGLLVHVTSHCFAYDNKPIAEPGETSCVPEDPDRLLPATLKQRSNMVE